MKKYKFISFLLILNLSLPITSAFSDVKPQDPNLKAFQYLQNNQIIQGYPDGTFKPESQINRAEVTKISVLSAELPLSQNTNCFPDLDPTQWYAVYVCTAFENKIVSGYPDGTFKPEQNIIRVEALKIISESLNLPSQTNSTNSSSYSDYNNNEWYSNYLNTYIDLNYLPYKLLIQPEQKVTRREFSEIFYRSLTSNKSKYTEKQDTTFQLESAPSEVIQMLTLINQERTSIGLQPVEYSNQLSNMAELHSKDMIARNYFSHTNPDGKDIDTRRIELGISTFVGENISKNTSVENSHNSLMNSPGHKANILNPLWNRLGLGIIKSGNTYYITQEFSLYPINPDEELNKIINSLNLQNLNSNSEVQQLAQDLSLEMATSQTTQANSQKLSNSSILDGKSYSTSTGFASVSTDLETLIKSQLEFLDTNSSNTEYGIGLSSDNEGNFYFLIITLQ